MRDVDAFPVLAKVVNGHAVSDWPERVDPCRAMGERDGPVFPVLPANLRIAMRPNRVPRHEASGCAIPFSV